MSKCVRMTKSQQLQLCVKKKARPEIRLKELTDWAKAGFSLSKAPVKSTVLNALAAEKQMLSMSANCLAKKQRRSKRVLDIDSRVVGLIVLAEQCSVAIFGRVIINFAKMFSAELTASNGRRVLYTRTGWLRHLWRATRSQGNWFC